MTLPPDPDDFNHTRAEFADAAIQAFIEATHVEPENALSDLLCDLRHWADRWSNNEGFDNALHRANDHYKIETSAPAQAGE